MAAVALLGGGLALMHSSLLAVKGVDVVGARSTPVADVVHAAGLKGHPAMIDVGAARVERLVERLPWVERAQLSRRWPSRVRIVVVERRPVAKVPTSDHRMALVDRTGRVLAVVDVTPPHLPALGNVSAPGPAGSRLPDADDQLGVAAALPPDLRERVTDIATVAGGNVEMALSTTTVVRLGPAEELSRKMAALLTVLAGVDLRGVRSVDVRVPEAPVLTRS